MVSTMWIIKNKSVIWSQRCSFWSYSGAGKWEEDRSNRVMVAYACNPGTQKAEAGPPWDVWRFQESVDPSHSLVQDIQIIFKTVCSTSTNRATGSQVSGQFESCKISPISNYLFLPRSANTSILHIVCTYTYGSLRHWRPFPFSFHPIVSEAGH